MKIVVLPGDGIGPEVAREARACLELVSERGNLGFTFEEHDFGGVAIDRHGEPLPRATLAACKDADAILLGAVGGPKWDDAKVRPEAGLLAIRSELGLFANLRPGGVIPGLEDLSPLKPQVAEGTDVLVIRELTGGSYFGEKTLSDDVASDLSVYSRVEIERIAHVAFKAARQRSKKLTSVDKANVLATSKLWRRVVNEIAGQYPDVEIDHLYVDAAAMALVTSPRRFDVILTENMFGDILSDEMSVIGGSIGLLPSASVGAEGPGLFEPIHGSAPDIAGLDMANPAGAIASAAMLLDHGLGLPQLAEMLVSALHQTLVSRQPHRRSRRHRALLRIRRGGAREAGRPPRPPGRARGIAGDEPGAVRMKPRTLYEKIWDAHVVEKHDDGTFLIYIDRHLVHEVTSPQAFEGLRLAGRKVRRTDLTLAVADHNLPTTARVDAEGKRIPIAEPMSAGQLSALERNVAEFGVPYFEATAAEQGIVHVIGPEQGFTLPGTTLVCGDSHTASHGALGSLAFGIGTSEVEHVLATQTLILKPSKTMEVRVEGSLGFGVSPKDLILHLIGLIGAAGGNGHVIEYRGRAFREMSVEGRLTVANMSIEAGARSGLFAPDETTFDYIKGRPMAPKGADWDRMVEWWKTLYTDQGATFDKSLAIDASEVAPTVTWGTSPEDVVPVTGVVPDPASFADPAKRVAAQKSLDYMGLTPGTAMQDVTIENVFIGSCTNSRIEDLRAAAAVVRGRKVHSRIKQALIVPGSGLVKRQAEAEGLDRILIEAGFEWREPGCSMCLAMNPDKVPAGERCASTSNRNFVGRQGPGSRTHLVSPAMAAAAAISGRLADARELMPAEGLAA